MCTEIVNSILAECIGCPLEEILPGKHIIYDLLADSLALTDIVLQIEQRFGFTFDQNLVGRINSVSSIYDIVSDNASAVN